MSNIQGLQNNWLTTYPKTKSYKNHFHFHLLSSIGYQITLPYLNTFIQIYNWWFDSACGSDFRIDNGGKSQINSHAVKEKHICAMLTFSKQRTLTSSSLHPQGSSASTSTVEPPTLRLSAIEKKFPINL